MNTVASTGGAKADESADVAIVGGGAAGLATAIFIARAAPALRVVIWDGARMLGAKILISGGGRCNVTNASVAAAAYWGGSRKTIGRVLAAFPSSSAAAFFGELGVPLHEEDYGKLFPDSNRARSILDALLKEAHARGVTIRCSSRATAVRATETSEFRIISENGDQLSAQAVVLATGGMSFPKTGSDGGGYALARTLGHSIVPTTPALAPLELGGGFHGPLAGISHESELRIFVDRRLAESLTGPLLWTHFGVSGPLAMNAARVWHRAVLEGREVQLCLRFVPGLEFDAADRALSAAGGADSRRHVKTVLSEWVPARIAEALLAYVGCAGEVTVAHLSREHRRQLAHAMTELELPVRGSRGYTHAEATAGGVPLSEISAQTMESRVCAGLFLVGEILDVDGRIGGYNFQWAWSSAFVAACGVAAQFASRAGGTGPSTDHPRAQS